MKSRFSSYNVLLVELGFSSLIEHVKHQNIGVLYEQTIVLYAYRKKCFLWDLNNEIKL